MPLKIIPKIQIDNEPLLIQIIARRRPGDKPSFEPVMSQFSYAYSGKR